MTRRLLLAALVLMLAAPVSAGRVYLRYDLVSQRPDTATAYKPTLCSPDFVTEGSAYSASSVWAPVHWGLSPFIWAGVQVHMYKTTPQDAVRVKRYEWIQDEAGQWVRGHVAYTPEMTFDGPGPRTVGADITAMWALPFTTTGGVYYVLETRGCPIIYGAIIHGITAD